MWFQSWKLGFGASFLKGNPLPALLQWLVKLKTLVVSKFSLYFYHTLVQQTTPQEMRNLCSKHNVDYFHKYVPVIKYNCQNILFKQKSSILIIVNKLPGNYNSK